LSPPSGFISFTRLRRLSAAYGSRGPLERTRPLIDELRSIARGHGASISLVALSWTVSFNNSQVVAIPGASGLSRAHQSAPAMALKLTGKELSRIDEL